MQEETSIGCWLFPYSSNSVYLDIFLDPPIMASYKKTLLTRIYIGADVVFRSKIQYRPTYRLNL